MCMARIAARWGDKSAQMVTLWTAVGIAAAGAGLAIMGASSGSVLIAVVGVVAALSPMVAWILWVLSLLLLCLGGKKGKRG